MQTYPLKLAAAAPSTAFLANADLFVYESGVTTPDGGNVAIIVKPDNGNEITLKPGQRFRLPPGEKAGSWSIRTADPAVTLAGNLVIGSGEFDDANTLNTFKLDGTFTNAVKVTNTTGERVPVTLDQNQTINIAGNIMSYSSSYSAANQAIGSVTAFKLIDPVINVNGIVINKFEFHIGGGGVTGPSITLLGKASAPAGVADGDVYDFMPTATVIRKSDMTQGQIKIPAGKGLWLFGTNVSTFNVMSVLFTVL